MYRSQRFNLKDAVYLTLGATICVLLILVLIALSRERPELKDTEVVVDRRSSAPAQRNEPVESNGFSSACSCVNRIGKPQQWQTAPDNELPADFTVGGTLRQVWNAEPATLTPIISRDIYATIVHQEVFEKLIWRDLDPPFEYVPGLAQSWNVSDDGRTVEFHLFPNARWSDGQPVTADDVIFTLDLVDNDDIGAPVERAMLRELVEDWTRVDAHTVRFTLSEPYFDAVGVCGNRLWILPRHIYGQYTAGQFNSLGDLCIGSGPWLLDSWKRGRDLTLRRNEQYWGPKPAIEFIHVRFVSSERQELELFMNHEVDLIGPTAAQATQLRNGNSIDALGRFVSYETPLRGYTWLGYNLRKPMFDDARTRRALTVLLDRDVMIDTLLNGSARLVTGPFHPQTAQYNHDVEPLPYDPAEAARLLEQAGWRDTDDDGVLDRDLDGDGEREPFRLTFLIPSSALGRRIQRYVREQFAAAGIDVQLDSMTWEAYWPRVAAGDFDMIMQRSNSGPEIDAFEYWHSSQADGGRNLVGLRNDEVDDLIEQARRKLDAAQRMQIWRELHELIHNLQPQTFLWTTPREALVSHRVRGVQPRSLRLYTSEWYTSGGLQDDIEARGSER